MPSNDRRSAADMTTDELAAAIRQRSAAHARYTAGARPATERLAKILRERLAHIPTSTTGELAIHLSCFLTDALPLFQAEGASPNHAAQLATNVMALAGVELYDSGETLPSGDDAATAQVTAFVEAWDDRSDLIGSYGQHKLRMTDLRNLLAENAGLRTALKIEKARCSSAQKLMAAESADNERLQAEQDADLRAIDAMITASVRGDAGGMALAFETVRKRFIGRIAELDASEAKAGGCQPNGDPIWEEQ